MLSNSPKNKTKELYVCQNCDTEHIRWAGKCSQCGTWNSIISLGVKTGKSRNSLQKKRGQSTSPLSLPEIEKSLSKEEERISTGMKDLDQVLGGGILPASLILLAGEPGVGKSTLMLELARHSSLEIYYFSGEESVQQIARRARRMAIQNEKLFISRETELEEVCRCIEEKKPKLSIIDSIQSLYHSETTGTAGNPTQLKEAALHLLETARRSGSAIFFTGHITKDGAIAGPRLLEHMVDVVLYFDSDRTNHYRLLRAIKNRFGAVGELAIFEMMPNGLQAVAALPLFNTRTEIPGSVHSLVLGGTRPLPVEVQALVSPSTGPAKRITEGLDNRRLVLLAAVLEKYLKELKLAECDIFANLVGGFSSDEPALDVPQCLAILSSCLEKPIPSGLASLGEVGLGGEIRPVNRLPLRIKELQNLGFQRVIVPENNFIHTKERDAHKQEKSEGKEEPFIKKAFEIEIESLRHVSELLAKLEG